MEDGDPERDDAEPVGDVEETPRGTDGDAEDDADARPRITTNEATEALLAILMRYSLVEDRLLRERLLRDLEAAERMTETEAREYVEGGRLEFLRDRYAEAGLRERAPLGRVVGADEMSEASPVDDASRVAARDALRAYRTLPTLHSYLGEVEDVRGGGAAHVDLERLASGNEHGSLSPLTRTVRVPVLALYDHVLFPGDSLPLLIDGRLDPEHAQMVALANAAAPPLKGFFGVVCIAGWLETDDPSGNASRTLRSSCPMVGTLAQIRKIAVGGAGETRLVATGRTRFTVKDPWSLLDGTDTGVVGVVFDVEVELLSDSAERPKMRRVFGDAGGSPLSKPRLGLTPHSASTYELFDPRALARRLRASPSLAVALGCAVRSRDISTTAKADDAKRDVEDDLPLDPALLSHRVASRAPVSLRTRYKLLCCDTVVDRLRLECKLFDVFSSSSSAFPDDDIGRHSTPRTNISLSCSSCEAPLSTLASLVAISDEGASGGRYVNPAGQVHDLLTVADVVPNAVALEGEPSAEFSWFPGFKWTVAVCVRCRQHLGWQFTADENARGEAASENRRNAGAGPGSTTLRRFFGLTRARVRADGFESLEALCDISETPYSQQAQSLDTYGSREWD
jgi:cereblon